MVKQNDIYKKILKLIFVLININKNFDNLTKRDIDFSSKILLTEWAFYL